MIKYIPLSELMAAVGEILDNSFGNRRFRILAEITDIKVYHNRGYAFLNIAEKSGENTIAAAGAVIWRDHFHIIKDFEKATGTSLNQNIEVVMEVEVQFHIRYGLRISITGIDESYTLGKMVQEREKTLLLLAKENPQIVWVRNGEYRSANQLLNLPTVIQNVALIAAPGSDGRRDFLHELENNPYHIDYSVTEFAAQVQGDAAAGQIASQLEKIQKIKNRIHAVAIVRGGGGNNDFSAFDSYKVSLAVAASEIPVFTGIGHERNISITDLLCHSPQKTPTKCASGITEHNAEFLAFLQNASGDIQKRALRMIDTFRQQTRNFEGSLLKSAQWTITKQKQWLEYQINRLQLADPVNTLKRGFALVYFENRHISRAKELKSTDEIRIRFADSILKATIHD